MNEPLIILYEIEDGPPVRRFVDGDPPHGGGAAQPDRRADSFLAPDLAQRALLGAAEVGQVAAALMKASLRLARRR